MANEKHTPGPWIFSVEDDGITDLSAVVFIDDDGPGRCSIAEIQPQRECVANARLIAAAPELLEALKAFRDLNKAQPRKFDAAMAWIQNDDLVRQMVDAAILKAEGTR